MLLPSLWHRIRKVATGGTESFKVGFEQFTFKVAISELTTHRKYKL